MFNILDAVSPYDSFCDGFSSPGGSGKNYLVGLTLGIGKAPLQLTHTGSSLLDGIIAFDKAEVEDAYLGQINMITVSSFCGLAGRIWGYHLCQPKHLFSLHPYFPKGKIKTKKGFIPVYSADPLLHATKRLFGTLNHKRFPLLPGSHVPCAGKFIKEVGPRHIYAGFALGIAAKQDKDANLFMEDIGDIPIYIKGTEREAAYKEHLLGNLAKSVTFIGENQDIAYKEIFVTIKDIFIQPDEMGCALVAAPYFTLAKNAALGIKENEDYSKLSLESWEKRLRLPAVL